MKVLLFWLIRWGQEILSPSKQLFKLHIMFKALVSCCGVILFVVLANLSLFSVANAEVTHPRMSTNVKHVGVLVHRYNSNNNPIANDEKTIQNISQQIKKSVLGDENAQTFLIRDNKVAQLSVQIEVTAQEYARNPITATSNLKNLIQYFNKEGFAVHLLLSLHYKIEDSFGGKDKKFWEDKYNSRLGTFVPYEPCNGAQNDDCPYDIIFNGFHKPIIADLNSDNLLKDIAVIYVYNEFNYDDKTIAIIDPNKKTSLTETALRTLEIALKAANSNVPIGIKLQWVSGNGKSAWNKDSLSKLLSKNIVLGYDCYDASEDKQCSKDKALFSDAIGKDKLDDYKNGRIEIAEYGRNGYERTEAFMTNLVKYWSESSGFALYAFNSTADMSNPKNVSKPNNSEMYTIAYTDIKGGSDLKYTFIRENELKRLRDQMEVVVGCSFSDVKEDTKGRESIRELCHLGVMSGYDGSGLFKPESTLNRAEMTKISLLAGRIDPNWKDDGIITNQVLQDNAICKTGYYTKYGYEQVPFLDVSKDMAYGWACSYISYAKLKKILSGYKDGYFRPGQNVNWGETAKIVLNTVFDNPTLQKVPGEWYASYITCFVDNKLLVDEKLDVISSLDNEIKNQKCGLAQNQDCTALDVRAQKFPTRAEIAVTLFKAIELRKTKTDLANICSSSKGKQP